MPDQVTETHIRILRERVTMLRPGGEDLTFCVNLYEQHSHTYKPVGKALIDEMIVNVARLYKVVSKPDDFDKHHVDIATAALIYFLEDDDHIPDDYGYPGLVDDALVVRAACREIGDALPE